MIGVLFGFLGFEEWVSQVEEEEQPLGDFIKLALFARDVSVACSWLGVPCGMLRSST